ncbi:MAG: hypothetical protein V1899_06120 [Planctomycetota bacterium]
MTTRSMVPALLVFCVLGAHLPAAEEIRLPITADNSICCYASKKDTEQGNNMGRSPRIKMKGIENIMIFNFDTTPLKDRVVTKAVLHIKAAEKNVMVRKVGFSTIATPWNEGKSPRDTKGTKGDSCYKTPDLESVKLWGGPDSCFLDTIWSRGGTLWTQSYVTHDDNMWFTMEFDGRLLEACAAGLSNGIAVSDDNGQVKSIHKDVVPDGNDSDNYFFAREENSSQPYFTVQLDPMIRKVQAEKINVTVQPWPAGADLQTGGLEISWAGPFNAAGAKELLAYRIKTSVAGAEMKDLPRWAHPPLALPGEKNRALLRFQPAGAEVKVRVEVVGRGGGVIASGEGSGKVSPALATPPKLALDAARSGNTAAPPPGNAVATVWAVPDCVKVNPITGNVQEEKNVNYEGDAAGTYNQSNATWSGKNKTVSLNALRGEWIAYQVVCQNSGKESVSYKIKPSALIMGNVRIAENAVKLSRLWYQKVGKSAHWYADPMLPLNAGDAFEVPDVKNAVPDQKNQTVYVEFFVPKDAKPGSYTGTLEVTAGTAAPIALAINLTVGSAAIPDKEHFIWSMNAYNSPGRGYGAANSAEFINAERSFYVMGHEHRTCLAVLHYSHSGKLQVKLPLAGKGKEMKVSDWSAFDNRFGPLFDASAFKNTSRQGVPLDHFYLMLSEHYPMSMADGYKWNNETWENHWKVAGSIEEGFSQDYKDAWVAVAKDHIKHFKEKGYKTSFQVYLNDKYYHKQYADRDGTKGLGKGVSFWLLDEPFHIDDFSALTFFGKLLRQAQEGDRQSVIFRADISRPQWGRDTVDRVVDLNVTGGLFSFRPWLEDWQERYGQRVWTYGSVPSSTVSALGIIAQGLSLYSHGADGYLPWQALGEEKNWTEFEKTCVFYTGKPMGINGVCASLRLKAYRRAEQDIEYVWLVADKLGLLKKNDPNRRQVAELLRGAIKATKKLGVLDSQGAVTESFSDLCAEDFEQLRQTLAALLK